MKGSQCRDMSQVLVRRLEGERGGLPRHKGAFTSNSYWNSRRWLAFCYSPKYSPFIVV